MDKDKPNYIKGHAINLGFQAVLIGLALGCASYCWWENKQRAAGKRDHRLQGLTDEEKEKLGENSHELVIRELWKPHQATVDLFTGLGGESVCSSSICSFG